MTSRDFCFWLQGYLEIGDPSGIPNNKLEIVKKHLCLVFKHEIDPSKGDKKHQDELNKLHDDLINKPGWTASENDVKIRC